MVNILDYKHMCIDEYQVYSNRPVFNREIFFAATAGFYSIYVGDVETFIPAYPYPHVCSCTCSVLSYPEHTENEITFTVVIH